MNLLNRSWKCFPILAALAALPTATLALDEAQSPVEGILIVHETDWYADGASVRRAPYVIAATPEGVYAPDPARTARAAAKGLSIRNTTHWKLGQNLSFKVTDHILDQKFDKLIKKSLANDVNKPRGTSGVPRQKVTKKKTKIIDIEDFANPSDFYFQKNFNSTNEIIMTADDQFFQSFPGQILFDPDRIATTRRFSFAQCTRQGGDIICPFFNVEADAYLRKDFFDRAQLLYEIILAGIFRQTLGYNNTIWTNDLLGSIRPYLTEATFEDRGSGVWRQVMDRDGMFYPKGFISRQRAAKALMMPRPNTVLDFGGELQPERFQTDISSFRPTLILTNLHAAKTPRGPNSNMTVVISWVEKERDAAGNVVSTKTVKTSLKGKTEDFPVALQGTNEVGLPTLFLSDVGFASTSGATKAIDRIRDAIAEQGEAMEIDGVQWARALRIEIQAKGRLTDTAGLARTASRGPTKKVKQAYYAVNSDQEAVDPPAGRFFPAAR